MGKGRWRDEGVRRQKPSATASVGDTFRAMVATFWRSGLDSPFGWTEIAPALGSVSVSLTAKQMKFTSLLLLTQSAMDPHS